MAVFLESRILHGSEESEWYKYANFFNQEPGSRSSGLYLSPSEVNQDTVQTISHKLLCHDLGYICHAYG